MFLNKNLVGPVVAFTKDTFKTFLTQKLHKQSVCVTIEYIESNRLVYIDWYNSAFSSSKATTVILSNFL